MAEQVTASDLNRHPAYQVRINGTVVPEEMKWALEAITVQQDVAGLGMFTLRLEDWEPNRLEVYWMDQPLLSVGNAVQILMGYAGDRALTTLIDGDITGLEPEFSAEAPPRLTVRGYDKRHRLARGHKTRTFVQMTDSEIVHQIAVEAGFQAQVDDTGVRLEYVLQYNQTDLAFIQTRAEPLGYEVVVQGNRLSFRRPPAQQRAAVTLSLAQDLLAFSPRLSTMTQVGQLAIRGWDPKQKVAIAGHANATAGMGATTGPQATRRAFGNAATLGVQRPVFTQAEADALAQGQFHAMALSYISGEGTCVGCPALQPGIVVRIDGAGQRFSGPYYVTSATHTLAAGDYRTAFTCRRNAT
jgi:phage protein D